MTEIREQGFAIDLPGDWDEVESDEPGTRRYRERGGEGRLSVTLLGVSPVYAIADERMLLDQYVQHRSQYEKGQRRWLAQSEPRVETVDGAIEGAWDAEDPGVLRHLRHRVLLHGGILADACFEAPADGFDERASAVLGTLRVEAP